MKLEILLDQLFPLGHVVQVDNQVVRGSAMTEAGTVTVIGTAEHAEIGVEHALSLADAVLESSREHPEQAIVMLVDTAGQRLSRRDELLGINGYLGHLAQCLEVARNRGARLVGVVYSEAVSGGFLSFGMMADQVYAVSDAQIRVMDLRAMSRVTKQPLDKLGELSRTSPVFAPGVENYVAMGAVKETWDGNLADRLIEALEVSTSSDQRRLLGHQRAGRKLAHNIADKVAQGVF